MVSNWHSCNILQQYITIDVVVRFAGLNGTVAGSSGRSAEPGGTSAVGGVLKSTKKRRPAKSGALKYGKVMDGAS